MRHGAGPSMVQGGWRAADHQGSVVLLGDNAATEIQRSLRRSLIDQARPLGVDPDFDIEGFWGKSA